jgi:hypothetical protein
MKFNQSIHSSLKKGAFFAETHAIKGVLAAKRLQDRFNLSHERFSELVGWRHVLDSPDIDTLFSNHVTWDRTNLTEQRLRYMIEGAVFPMAYVAAVEWTKRNGFENLVQTFRDAAISRIGHLGHSWTIWCSFLEVKDHLNKNDESFASERFAEFVASQLSRPDWLSAFDFDFGLTEENIDADVVADSVLRNPGFYGHSAITLAYTFKYKDILSKAQFNHALIKMQEKARNDSKDSGLDFESSLISQPKKIEDSHLQKAVMALLENGPKEVHSITLADAMCSLWDYSAENRRRQILAVLNVIRDWRLERSSGGERKK